MEEEIHSKSNIVRFLRGRIFITIAKPRRARHVTTRADKYKTSILRVCTCRGGGRDVKLENCASHVVIYVRNLALLLSKCIVKKAAIQPAGGESIFVCITWAGTPPSPTPTPSCGSELLWAVRSQHKPSGGREAPSHEHLLMCGLFCFPLLRRHCQPRSQKEQRLRRENQAETRGRCKFIAKENINSTNLWKILQKPKTWVLTKCFWEIN